MVRLLSTFRLAPRSLVLLVWRGEILVSSIMHHVLALLDRALRIALGGCAAARMILHGFVLIVIEGRGLEVQHILVACAVTPRGLPSQSGRTDLLVVIEMSTAEAVIGADEVCHTHIYSGLSARPRQVMSLQWPQSIIDGMWHCKIVVLSMKEDSLI